MSRREKIDFQAWPEIKHIAERLLQAREAAGLTQTQAAKLLGTAQSYVAALETGYANPTAQVLAQIARLYKIAPSTLWPCKPVNRRADQPRRPSETNARTGTGEGDASTDASPKGT